MSWVQENLLDNPMMAEVGRFRQVARGKTLGSIGLRAVLLFALLIAGFITWIAMNTSGDMPPGVPITAQLAFCCIAIPLRFYGAIAGERERRSWELLRVAPVTNSQIAVGKLASMVFMALLIHAIFLLPLLFSLVSYYSDNTWRTFGMPSYRPPTVSLDQVFLAEIYSIIVSVFVCSLTLFFSARSKRAFTALALTLGTLLSVFVFMPAVISLLLHDPFLSQATNPFGVVFSLSVPTYSADEMKGFMDAGNVASFICMATLAGVFVVYASKTMAFADNLVKFIPKKK